MNTNTEAGTEVVVTETPRKRKPYNLKANTKASQVRALVRRWHKHPHAEKIILNKTMELGFTRNLARVYIRCSAKNVGVHLPTLNPAPTTEAETAEA